MARASSSSSCTEIVKSSLRRVLRLNHLGDMHGSDAGGCVSFVGLWITKFAVVVNGFWVEVGGRYRSWLAPVT